MPVRYKVEELKLKRLMSRLSNKLTNVKREQAKATRDIREMKRVGIRKI